MKAAVIAIGILLGSVLAIGMLSIISYNENKMFCEMKLSSCKDPWIPIFNM